MMMNKEKMIYNIVFESYIKKISPSINKKLPWGGANQINTIYLSCTLVGKQAVFSMEMAFFRSENFERL